MSHYGDYIRERENRSIIETGYGFATYKIFGGNQRECYLCDIFIIPEFRKEGKATRLAEMIEAVAIKAGCDFLSGSVDPKTNNATISLKALLAYGFELAGMDEHLIWFKKELNNG